MQDDKPLVSYLLLSYNQERYIKKAVESALAQTYTSLEIIISDDCSKDKTFEIIKETVADYKGPHKVILNRNEHNLGIAGNVNKAIAMARGELFVMAAGDDISFPERTQVLFDYWYPQKKCLYAITSSNVTICENGEISHNQIRQIKENTIESDILTSRRIFGAAIAYSSILFKIFGEIIDGAYEDLILYRRALMLGKVLFLKEPLIKHRIGSGITTNKETNVNTYDNFIYNTSKIFNVYYKVYCQIKNDSKLISSSPKNFNQFIQRVDKALTFHKLKVSFFSSSRSLKKIKVLYRLFPYINRHISFMSYENLDYTTWIYLSLDLFPTYTRNSLFKTIKFIINILRELKRFTIR